NAARKRYIAVYPGGCEGRFLRSSRPLRRHPGILGTRATRPDIVSWRFLFPRNKLKKTSPHNQISQKKTPEKSCSPGFSSIVGTVRGHVSNGRKRSVASAGAVVAVRPNNSSRVSPDGRSGGRGHQQPARKISSRCTQPEPSPPSNWKAISRHSTGSFA